MPATAAPLPPNPGNRQIRLFTVAEYLKLFEHGILTEQDRVELLDGLITLQLPRGPQHDYSLSTLNKDLHGLVPDAFSISCRSALMLATSVPEPDYTLARGELETYRHRHPGAADTALVVEVSASSLQHDRHDKGRIYARAGIPVYWVVNVVDKVIEVYTQPSGPGDAPAYGQRDDYAVGTAVPVVLDGTTIGTIAVADVMS